MMMVGISLGKRRRRQNCDDGATRGGHAHIEVQHWRNEQQGSDGLFSQMATLPLLLAVMGA